MLPRGYSPKITNGMVRRERALRRLQEKVDLDEESLESGERGLKAWSKKLFHHSREMSDDVAMSNLSGKKTSSEPSSNESPDRSDETPTEEVAPDNDGEDTPATQPTTDTTTTPKPAKRARPPRSRPKALNVLPTQPEGSELRTVGSVGRHSPSSFARERMRAIAAKNAPFDDPDASRPKCRFSVPSIA